MRETQLLTMERSQKVPWDHWTVGGICSEGRFTLWRGPWTNLRRGQGTVMSKTECMVESFSFENPYHEH
jgi:hypothetical protein